MKTHNRLIFHCERCGRVVNQEPDKSHPACCGRTMTQAAVETVSNAGEEDVIVADEPATDEPATDEPPRKPR